MSSAHVFNLPLLASHRAPVINGIMAMEYHLCIQKVWHPG